jgi:hypothetical protein
LELGDSAYEWTADIGHPNNVFFSGDSVPLELVGVHGFDPETWDAAKIREVASAIRELERKLQSLNERKKNLGY